MDRFVKVTCNLASPVAGLQLPYLDALVTWRMARRAKSIMESANGARHQYEIAERGHEIAPDALGKIPIPISTVWVGRLPIPRCSNPIAGEVASDYAAHFTSAFPLDQSHKVVSTDMGRVRMGGGRFKSFRLPLRLRLVDRIVWFAVLREMPSVLRHLLKDIRNIGKKTSQGHGVVAGWDIEIIESDLSWYAPSDDGPVLMRTLPHEMEHPHGLLGARRYFGGCVAPYWQRDFWTEILEPC